MSTQLNYHTSLESVKSRQTQYVDSQKERRQERVGLEALHAVQSTGNSYAELFELMNSGALEMSQKNSRSPSSVVFSPALDDSSPLMLLPSHGAYILGSFKRPKPTQNTYYNPFSRVLRDRSNLKKDESPSKMAGYSADDSLGCSAKSSPIPIAGVRFDPYQSSDCLIKAIALSKFKDLNLPRLNLNHIISFDDLSLISKSPRIQRVFQKGLFD